METRQHPSPILIDTLGKSEILSRIPLSGTDSDYNEEYIQNLVFTHPASLPINEIDTIYSNAIPVCCELNTPAGPLDILYVTPEGRLVIAEAKLWRNPEARRKVVAQILDYAKELSKWDYEDLQREVSKATEKKGNVLFDLVSENHPNIIESEFVDEVTRSLKNGRFLLLIIGDGIREGVGAIAEFIQSAGNLEFSFGLVEVGLYKTHDGSTLIQPRVLAKTLTIKKYVIALRDGQLSFDDEEIDENNEITEPNELENFYLNFWPELVNELKLDDPSQPMPRSTSKKGNIYLMMPVPGGLSWLTVYFLQSKGHVGVFLTFYRGMVGDSMYAALVDQKEDIEAEIGKHIHWESKGGKHMISAFQDYEDLRSPSNREAIKSFLKEQINLFVNCFRPKLEKLSKDLEL